MKRPHPHHEKPSFLPPKITDDPLHRAFDRKYAIHAGMMAPAKVSDDPESFFLKEAAAPATEPPATAVAYAHIPFCSSRCLFCGFYSAATRPEAMRDYARLLEQEIRMSGKMIQGSQRTLSAVYFGGGTPTDLDADDLRRLLSAARESLPLCDECEITVEGRLHGFDDEKLSAALDAGANRFSFGVQCFDTGIRQRLGRKLDRHQIIERLNQIVETAEAYKAAVVIDLIYGLPGQTMKNLIEDIDTMAQQTGIHGLDLYQINLIPGTPMVEQKSKLPPIASLQEQADLFTVGRQRLIDHGFERLSIAHWRRSEREASRYNSAIKYGVECLPLGAGAGGRWGRARCMQQADLATYAERVTAGRKPVSAALAVSPNHAVCSIATGQLDQRFLDIDTLEACSATPLRETLLPALTQWQKAGLIEEGEPWRLTTAGEFWAVNLQQLIIGLLQIGQGG